MVRRTLQRLLAVSREAAQLGLSDAGELNEQQLDTFASWDLFHRVERIFGDLEPWEHQALARYFPPGRRVLVGCVGAGRELVALDRLGFDVDAFDCCASLVYTGNRALAERGVTRRITLAEPDAVPSELAGPYDGCVLGWGGYMHIVGTARRVAFLRELRTRLAPGAPLLLSFFVRGPNRPVFRAVASIASAMRVAWGRREAIEVGDRWFRGTYCHYFTRDEIAAELARGGFALEAFHRDPYGHAIGRAARTGRQEGVPRGG